MRLTCLSMRILGGQGSWDHGSDTSEAQEYQRLPTGNQNMNKLTSSDSSRSAVYTEHQKYEANITGSCN
jgi:hypothetical protein